MPTKETILDYVSNIIVVGIVLLLLLTISTQFFASLKTAELLVSEPEQVVDMRDATTTKDFAVVPSEPGQSEPMAIVVSDLVGATPSVQSTPIETPEVAVNVYEVTAAHQAALLASHNSARSNVGVNPLGWSTSVAASAQDWADVLATRGCGLQHSTNSPYGENLASAWTSRTSATLDPADAVRRWVAEKADYTFSTNTCTPGAVCGHYTQVVWADSTQVGCGVAVCTDDGFAQVWVCQYNPPGNYVGQQPY